MRRKYLVMLGSLLKLEAESDELLATKRSRPSDSDWMEDVIDDLLLLATTRIEAPLQRSHRLNLERMTDHECITMCRFRREHLIDLCELLFETPWISSDGSTSHVYEAFPMFLFRLAKNHDYMDMQRDFGVGYSKMSVICNAVLSTIWDRWHHLLVGPNICLTRAELLRSADAISKKLGLSQRVVMGFIDGKLFETCRPMYGQEAIYNGKDRCHGLKWQGALAACGILFNFAGPQAGRRHDAYVWHESQLYALLEEVLQGIFLALFGDSAYPRSARMLKPYVGINLTEAEHAFNDRWCSGTNLFSILSLTFFSSFCLFFFSSFF